MRNFKITGAAAPPKHQLLTKRRPLKLGLSERSDRFGGSLDGHSILLTGFEKIGKRITLFAIKFWY